MNQKQLSVQGVEISYRESAGTGPPVILIHGNSASSATWVNQMDGELGETYRLLAIDLPAHGKSGVYDDVSSFSISGYASTVLAFAEAVGAADAALVGWSLGGHIAIETVPIMAGCRGVAVFGTPPLGMPPAMDEAFRPNEAMAYGFAPELTPEQAAAYAQSFLAPGSPIPLETFTGDILATRGVAREQLMVSVGEGRFSDELEIVATMTRPLALMHGAGEQLVSGQYLALVDAPTLWRGEVQILAGAGHAPHIETPEEFNELLSSFLGEISESHG